MSKLKEAALSYAKHRWPIFPCKKDKTPYIKNWQTKATTNQKRIKEWWGKWPDANIGFVPAEQNMLVLDCDPGHEFDELEENIGEVPETKLVQYTPRGGRHEFFQLGEGEIVPPSASKLAPYVDVRSSNSYVLLSPSETNDGKYEWDVDPRDGDVKPAYRTDGMIEKSSEACERSEDHDTWLIEPDLTENVEKCVKWLEEEAKPAIEGLGGDNLTIATAMMCKSYGISQERAFGLLWDHWNDRCEPPWDADDLELKISNAYSYNSSPPGNKTGAYKKAKAKALFSVVSRDSKEEATEGPSLLEAMQAALGNEAASYPSIPLFSLDDLGNLPPPEWDIQNLIGRGKIGMIVGLWGHYKSFVVADQIAYLTTGKSWPALSDDKCKQYDVPEPRRVLYIAAEGDPVSFGERILAAVSNNPNIELTLVKGNLRITGASAPLDTVPGQVAIANAIENFTKEVGGAPEVIFCDTLAKSMAGEENSNTDMGTVLRVAGAVQQCLGCTFVFVHHQGKDKKDKTGRGASALPAGLDFIIHVKGDEQTRVATVNVEKQKDAPAEKGIILQGSPVRNSLAFSRVANIPFSKTDATKNLYFEALENIITDADGDALSTSQLVRSFSELQNNDFGELDDDGQKKAVESARGWFRRNIVNSQSSEAAKFKKQYQVLHRGKSNWQKKVVDKD
ncbi:MAG: bifunctional DNA primase/polymerase [Magnetovibrio sp.]|nr:bifunctional DNA primase/polymerase [Magnetovibrio sp.]